MLPALLRCPNMNCLLLVVISLGVAVAAPRVRRQAFVLPDGAELIVGPIKTGFNCGGLTPGLYGDVDNNCKVFHVCNPVVHSDGTQEVQHYSFFCGNQTIFNQYTQTCATPDEAIPCPSTRDFFYLNERIGQEKAHFLDENDVRKAEALILRTRR